MLDKYLQIESLSIVFIGDFNPVIVQPFWLSSKGLIREDEASNAKVDIIHNELVKIEWDWVSLEISKQRFELKSNKKPYFETVKDLSINIFTILKETPIRSIGINHIFDLSLLTSSTYYEFGNKLSPLTLWNDSLNDARLLQIEILEDNRHDSRKGWYRVRISPSDQKHINFGIAININDHLDCEDLKKPQIMEMINKLKAHWEESKVRSRNVVTDILTKTLSK